MSQYHSCKPLLACVQPWKHERSDTQQVRRITMHEMHSDYPSAQRENGADMLPLQCHVSSP